jgi:hypothetical protein
MFTSTPFDITSSTADSPIFSAAPVPPTATIATSAPPIRRNDAALADVLRHPAIWRRGAMPALGGDALSTGLAALDALLPGGGWPRGALTEILIDEDGIGECSLLLPALATLTAARRRVVFVAPPYIPYAPALAAAGVDLAQLVHIDAAALDTHWTAEQCLRAGCCGAVLNWLPRTDYRQLRRLQLAAETGGAIGFVFRPIAAARETSPAALRLKVVADAQGPRIEILKCRGRFESTQAVRLSA